MAGITKTGLGSSASGLMSQAKSKSAQSKQSAMKRKIVKPSERSQRVKTGSQKSKEMQGLNINRKGLKGSTIAVKNAISETGKGNGVKAFG